MTDLGTLAVGVLAVWRASHFLAVEDGPWRISARVRRRAGTGFWGSLVACFYCVSVWIAAPVAALIAQGWIEGLLLVPALSGGAILLQRATAPTQRSAAQPSAEHGRETE